MNIFSCITNISDFSVVEIPQAHKDKIYILITINFGGKTNVLNNKEISSGMAHLLEHLNSRVLKKYINSFDTNLISYTTYNSTNYLFSLYKEKVDADLEIILDVLLNPKWTLHDFNIEREIIAQENKIYHQNSSYNSLLLSIGNLISSSHLNKDITGLQKDITNFSFEEALYLQSNIYISNNIIISSTCNSFNKENLKKNSYSSYKRKTGFDFLVKNNIDVKNQFVNLLIQNTFINNMHADFLINIFFNYLSKKLTLENIEITHKIEDLGSFILVKIFVKRGDPYNIIRVIENIIQNIEDNLFLKEFKRFYTSYVGNSFKKADNFASILSYFAEKNILYNDSYNKYILSFDEVLLDLNTLKDIFTSK